MNYVLFLTSYRMLFLFSRPTGAEIERAETRFDPSASSRQFGVRARRKCVKDAKTRFRVLLAIPTYAIVFIQYLIHSRTEKRCTSPHLLSVHVLYIRIVTVLLYSRFFVNIELGQGPANSVMPPYNAVFYTDASIAKRYSSPVP